MRRVARLALLLLFIVPALAQERVTLEMPYEGGVITITADRVSGDAEGAWIAEGNVVARYAEQTLKTQRLVYNKARESLLIEGNLEITHGIQWIKGSRAEIDLRTDTGTIYDAEGFTDQELFLKARVLTKTGPKNYRAQHGYLSACSDKIPKWSFTVRNANIPLGGSARLKNTFFRIKNVPVFYLPFVLFPTEKKERSSGFLLPTTGNSTIKGRRISQAVYLTLGRSSDITLTETYYSKRGFGHGVLFRTRPNDKSSLELDGFGVDDRKGQGGASLIGFGETFFGNGYRAVADFNLVSDFTFRRVFSEDFFTATRPTQNSRVFVTNNYQDLSVNALLSREETVFPRRNIVISSAPALVVQSSARRIFNLPFYFDLDLSARGFSRSDSLVTTPGLTERLDFFPKAYVSVPLFQGLRVTPQVGVRETFYTSSVIEEPKGALEWSDKNLHRNYAEFVLDLEGWQLSKVYKRKNGSSWLHTIEPVVRYRYLHGVDEFDQIIRFDEDDAIVNTNEVEYDLYSRFFVKRKVAGILTNHEWLSIRVAQKRYFDPSFSGAFEAGRINQFYPFMSLTGFHFGGIERTYSPVLTQVRFSPKPGTSFDARGDYDPVYGRFRNFSVTGYLNRPGFSVGMSYFITRKLELGTFESNQLQASFHVGNLAHGLSASTQFSYDAATSRFLNSLSRANYFFDCCGMSLEFQAFNLGARQEKQIRFSFFLKGIGAFGTIKRPPNVF
jgi:LPS-assembly protein